MNSKLLRKAIVPLLATASLANASGAFAADVVAKVRVTSLGKIVVDGKAKSAYFFDLDKANSGTSACSAACAANWPAITSSTVKPHVSGISAKVGTIPGPKGSHQVTINGRPIYTFAFDKVPGDVKGEGAQGLWYVISPLGREIKALKVAAKASSAPTKASTYGRSNY